MTTIHRGTKFTSNNLQFGFFNDNYLNDPTESIRNMTAEVYNSQGSKKSKKRMKKANCNGQNDCTHCVDEREIRHVELEENQLLWSELREHILYMYKIGRDQNLGPTLVDRVKYLVDTLCSKDIHQLFIRVEILACDVIKDCLESVERIFVNEFRNTTVAFNYLESIITDCDNYLFAARKMLPMLKNLESHIKKFNMCWVLLHQNLFRIYYLEDSRCKIRAKKAKLMLLSDMEVPAFTETILKFSQFTEAFNVLADQWNDSVIKIKKYRESRPVYLNCQHFLYDTWQDFNINKKNKHPIEKLNLVDSKVNKKTVTSNLNQQKVQLSMNATDNYSVLSKSQAKKVRRKSRTDHSRQPSADLMPPPPPPRVFDTNLTNTLRLENDYDNQIITVPREKLRKKVESPHTPPKKQSNSQGQDHKYVGDRDVDELVAFIEGFTISDKNVDAEESENKKRRKKQKKEKQRLKKMQSMLQDDQVAQLIKRSPGVTITMVRPNNETCTKSTSTVRNSPETIPPKPSPVVRIPQMSQNHPVKEPPVTTNNNTNPGSRMVTIRRINEANTDEPTVTITLKGPTPDQDQVLYRIINGQADYGLLADSVLNKKAEMKKEAIENKVLATSSPPVPSLSKNEKKKNRRKQNQNDLTIEAISPQFSPNNDYFNYYYSHPPVPPVTCNLPDESVQITKSIVVTENETNLTATKKAKRKKDKTNPNNNSMGPNLQCSNPVNPVANQNTSKISRNSKEAIDNNYYGENTIVVINSAAKNNNTKHQKSIKIEPQDHADNKISHKSTENLKQIKTQKNEISKQNKLNSKTENHINKLRQNPKISPNSKSDDHIINNQRKNDNTKVTKPQKPDETKTKTQKMNDSKTKSQKPNNDPKTKSPKIDESRTKLQKTTDDTKSKSQRCEDPKSKSSKNDDVKIKSPRTDDTKIKSQKPDESKSKNQKPDDAKPKQKNDTKPKPQKIDEPQKVKPAKQNDANKTKQLKTDDNKTKSSKLDDLKLKPQKNDPPKTKPQKNETNSPKQTKTTPAISNSNKNQQQQKVKDFKTYNNGNISNNSSENRRSFTNQQLKQNKDDSTCAKNIVTNQISQKTNNELLIEPPLNSYKLIPENLRLPAGITITKVPSNATKKPINDPKRSKYVRNSNFHSDLCTNQVSFATESISPKITSDLPIDLVIEKQQQLEQDFEVKPENRQPPIGTGVPRTYDAPAKFIRAPDGRIIIRSPMARSTTPPLNPITMIRQDLEMGVAPPNVPVSPFWTRNDWWLPGTDNVFAPKDIDLEDNTLDAEERELEAFKRFCQEPVPPQRQEVTHLNVQKIIIKKNQHS